MRKDSLFRGGRWLGALTLFVLPWQTRYIFWRPWVGTTESEFGVISLYGAMIISGIAALCFLLHDAEKTMKETTGKVMRLLGAIVLGGLGVFAWWQSYPSPAHAWILHVVFAMCVGYVSYRLAKEDVHIPLRALVLGLVAPFLLGIWQMCGGSSPDSTLLGLAAREVSRAGDAVVVFGQTRILRMYGSFPHPNIFGTALTLVFAGIASHYNFPRQKFGATLAMLAVIAFVALCVSRSAALAMFCAGVIWFFTSTSHKKALFACVLVLPPLVWLLQFFAPGLLAIRGSSFVEMQSLRERTQQIADWKDVMSHGGILGIGIYGYPDALAQRQEIFRAAWAYQPVHNIFLLLLAEIGIWWSAFGALVIARGAWIFKKTIMHMAPFFVALWSLAWFDHALWTSWSGMAYSAAVLGILLGKERN